MEQSTVQEERLDIPRKTASSPPISSVHLQVLKKHNPIKYRLGVELLRIKKREVEWAVTE